MGARARRDVHRSQQARRHGVVARESRDRLRRRPGLRVVDRRPEQPGRSLAVRDHGSRRRQPPAVLDGDRHRQAIRLRQGRGLLALPDRVRRRMPHRRDGWAGEGVDGCRGRGADDGGGAGTCG